MMIQWFPGHMAKARREATEKLKLVDVVVELVDARLPESSRNPLINEIIGEKPRLLVLNKADLADKNETSSWLEYYASVNPEQKVIAVSAMAEKDIKQLKKELKQMMEPKMARLAAKGVKARPIRLMILGIPNVGKSTLINRFLKKNKAQTGNRPGVTKGQQWLKIDQDFELLDTPGILWPKFEDQEVGRKLALTGAIKDTLFHKDEIALYALDFFTFHYPGRVQDVYRIDEKEARGNLPDFLLRLAKKTGFGEDYDRAAEKLIFDIRNGKLGAYTLDKAPASLATDGVADE